MFAYRLDELRLVQEEIVLSGVAAVSLNASACPVNKLRTIISATYYPDAAETRLIGFVKITRNGAVFPLRVPTTIALSGSIFYPLLTEGNQLVIYPYEYLQVTRDVATAGSVMRLRVQFVDSDMPFARYIEPQRELSIKRRLRGFAPLSNLGVTRAAMGSDEGGGEGGGVPGEGGGLPV